MPPRCEPSKATHKRAEVRVAVGAPCAAPGPSRALYVCGVAPRVGFPSVRPSGAAIPEPEAPPEASNQTRVGSYGGVGTGGGTVPIDGARPATAGALEAADALAEA